MTSENKRVSQLVELTAGEVEFDDMLLIIDATARESKRISALSLSEWLNGSASIYAYNAITADTASYIIGTNIDGLVNSSSNAVSSSNSLFSLVSSQSFNSISSSYSQTASFALNGVNNTNNSSSWASSSISASYSKNAFSSNYSVTTSYLIFSPNNGTSSYSINSQYTNHTVTADTASYFNDFTGITVASSSYSVNSDTASFIESNSVASSSYLIFSPNNGTSSYAMSAQSIAGIKNYGIFLSNTQSFIQSQLDDVDILWSSEEEANTPIEAVGTLVVPFTASQITNGTIFLATIDRNTGFQTVLDSVPVYYTNNNSNGSLNIPFSLMGQSDYYGSYMVYVSSSNNIEIEPTRTVRFNISSESDTLSAYANEPLSFSVIPNTAMLSYTTPVAGGPFTTSLSALLTTGSSNIFTLDATNQGIISIKYFWQLTNLTSSNISNNPISFLSGVPNSLIYFDCSICGLTFLYTFSSSSLNTLYCNDNDLTSLPNFPPSMSYINCSYNQLTSLNLPLTLSYLNCSNNNISYLPSPMPSELNTLLSDNNNLSSVPVLPDTVVTLSFNENTRLSGFPGNLPSQSGYISINYCPLTILPTIPSGVLYLSAQSCSLLSTSIDNITTNLSASVSANPSLINGTIDIRGNGLPTPTSLSNLAALNFNGWTILYDTY